MPKHRIVNADDYGRAPSVSAGGRQAHREGIVTSTTAMMNMPGVEAELRTALADGRRFPKLDGLIKCTDSLNTAEVKAEWRAQIEKFIQATSRPPTHLDSHHHTSYLTPHLFGAMLELAREFGCPIRMPLATPANVGDILGDAPSDLVQQVQAFIPPMLLASSDVRHPQYFEPRFYGEQATREMLHAIIAHLPEGVTELMCHPGLPDEGLRALTSYNQQRAVELAVLTDPGVREQVRKAEVDLISL